MPKFSAKKPLTIFVAVLAIVVLGVVAYLKMTPDLIPNMDFPYVIIVTTDPGASPESVESEITKPVEQSMATLDQIKSVNSTSQDSVSMVILEFEDGVNMDTISVDIQQKISMLQAQWDDMVSAPFVLKINPSMLPVEVAAVSYEGRDVNELSQFVNDTLSSKLEGISGVASVDVSGTVTSEAHVILSQKKLDALSKTLTDAINKQLDDAAGQLHSARSQVESARKAITDAEQSAIGGAVEGALGTVQNGLQTLQKERKQLTGQQEKLQALVSESTSVDAQLIETTAQITVLEAVSERSEEQEAQLSELQQQQTELTAKQEKLEAEFQSRVPSTVEELMTLPGVGRKTANVVASIIYDKPVIAVDTHVFRVSHRIGLVPDSCTTPLSVEKELVKCFPAEMLSTAHHWLILHGRYVCKARNPECDRCGLTDVCKSSFGKTH